jgi:hypothetical protein
MFQSASRWVEHLGRYVLAIPAKFSRIANMAKVLLLNLDLASSCKCR